MTTLELIHISEPMLTFGYDQNAEHPKDGLFLYGPLGEGKPAELRVGAIGTAQGLGCFRRWLQSIQRYIPAYDSAKPFHAAFPGFEPAYKTVWPIEPVAEIPVSGEKIARALRFSDRHDAIYKAVEIFEERLKNYQRTEDTQPVFWFVIIPEEVHRYGRPTIAPPKSERIPSDVRVPAEVAKRILREGSLYQEEVEAAQIYRYEVNFHNQLKARLLPHQIVVQIVRETSLTPEEFTVDGRPLRRVQDPATLAWNLCTTALFKAGGKPWKLAAVRPGVCYVGLVFKKDSSDPASGDACCGAQMFLNSGDGLVFRGHVGPWYSEAQGEFHLKQPDAEALISEVIKSYCSQHGSPPTELFIHGRARFNGEEWAGFSKGVPPETKLVGVCIQPSRDLKLFRPHTHPIIRGSALCLTDRLAYLWTKGFVPRLGTYTGWEVPNPISVEIIRGHADLVMVLSDVMGLTKVNFNACIFGDGLPVTLRFADAVGEILTAAPMAPDLPPLPFRHYI
jgi:hypothetical protein